MSFMKCRFCGKYAGNLMKSGDWICSDCIKMLGGMRHWFEIRKMDSDQVFIALGADKASLDGPVLDQSRHGESSVSDESTMRAKVRVNRNYSVNHGRKPVGGGCLSSIAIVFILIIALFGITVGVVSQDDTKGASNKANEGRVASSQKLNAHKETASKERVVYESSGLKVTFMGTKDVIGNIGIQFGLLNKINDEIMVIPQSASINDHMVQLFSGIPATIRPGKSFNQVWFTSPEAAGVSSYKDVKEIEIVLTYEPLGESSTKSKKTKLIHIDV